jgi:hypothetical protein
MKLLKHAVYEGEGFYIVEGSTGIHVVRVEEGSFSCTCPAYTYRKTCKHVEFAKGCAASGSRRV